MLQDEKKKKKTAEFWRYAAFLVVLFLIFIWLTSGLVRLQLDQADVYKEKAESTRTKTVYLRGKRGSIISSDSVILAEDQLVYNVTFQKDASANSKALYALYTKSISDTIDIIEKNGRWSEGRHSPSFRLLCSADNQNMQLILLLKKPLCYLSVT